MAGRLGGRRLRAPGGQGTRPTADRVRESLFSILGAVDGERVLDLFAGTGALGIEALSRGALSVTFVESARPALAVLRENLRDLALESPQAIVLATPVERSMRRDRLGEHAFELVLADPPYATLEVAVHALEKLAADELVAASARAALEHDARDEPTCEGWSLVDRRSYGTAAVSFFDRASR
ncbi:MAG: 16S rRNA (guanine(966)-N(2))-methyltransferase RsmD [Polyangiaceae bacterium]